MRFEGNGEFIVSSVLQELRKDVPTSISNLVKVGEKVSGEFINQFAKEQAMTIEVYTSSATGKMKLKITDDKQRCHLEALSLS